MEAFGIFTLKFITENKIKKTIMALPDRTKQWVVERFDGPSGLEFKEADIPKLGNHDILIKGECLFMCLAFN
jgi:hypothetical protein